MTAIVCCDISKRYRLRQASYYTLRDAIASVVAGVRGRKPEDDEREEFWALQEVSLEISRGQALGIVGANGSGKSTLLKIIAGVTPPTRGRVEVYGRVGALIEVGTGLHPELTGRENIFLYGAILGLSRRQISQKFDQIVQFSELQDFLDVPLKRYSSGMRVRLGFAVAAHLDPEILLVDEVLAVGDAAFQRKCIGYIRKLQEAGTTIVFVSHELPTVERLCQRVVWLDGGRIREAGASGVVIHHYLEAVERAFMEQRGRVLTASGNLAIERVALTDAEGRVRSEVAPGEPVTVNLHFRANHETIRAMVTLKIIDEQWWTLLVAHPEDEMQGLELRGQGVIRCTFPALPLAPRTYQIWMQILRLPGYREEIPWQAVGAFSVTGRRHETSLHPLDLYEWDTPALQLPSRWSVAVPDRAGVADG